MNNLDKQYTDLLQDILDNGVKKDDRTGTGTLSVFGRQIRHKMSEGFPLLTTKKIHFKSVVRELLWFLRGDTNIKYLVDNDCHIWDGDAYKNYCKEMTYHPEENWLDDGNNKKTYRQLSQEEFINKIKTDDEFAKKWGDLGPVYGKQWRRWNGKVSKYRDSLDKKGIEFGYSKIDQIANSINLLKTDPDSRRNKVSAWNVGELDEMVLPPCHTDFQFYTRELKKLERINIAIERKLTHETAHLTKDFDYQKWCDEQSIPTRAISLMWNQRSVDTFLGLPFNIASYGLLLEIIAKEVNMVPDELIGNLGDTHLYLNHIEQAKEQIGRELTDEERYNIWFTNNYETGMERYFDPSNLPDFDHEYYTSTPKRTREPYPLPKLHINDEFWNPDADLLSNLPHIQLNDFYVDNYQSHPTIKAPLSN